MQMVYLRLTSQIVTQVSENSAHTNVIMICSHPDSESSTAVEAEICSTKGALQA